MPKERNSVKYKIWRIVVSTPFEYFIMGLIVLNTVLLMMKVSVNESLLFPPQKIPLLSPQDEKRHHLEEKVAKSLSCWPRHILTRLEKSTKKGSCLTERPLCRHVEKKKRISSPLSSPSSNLSLAFGNFNQSKRKEEKKSNEILKDEWECVIGCHVVKRNDNVHETKSSKQAVRYNVISVRGHCCSCLSIYLLFSV